MFYSYVRQPLPCSCAFDVLFTVLVLITSLRKPSIAALCSPTCHAPNDCREVLFTVFRVLPCIAFQNTLYVAEAEAWRRYIATDTAISVVVVASQWPLLALIQHGVSHVVWWKQRSGQHYTTKPWRDNKNFYWIFSSQYPNIDPDSFAQWAVKWLHYEFDLSTFLV